MSSSRRQTRSNYSRPTPLNPMDYFPANRINAGVEMAAKHGIIGEYLLDENGRRLRRGWRQANEERKKRRRIEEVTFFSLQYYRENVK